MSVASVAANVGRNKTGPPKRACSMPGAAYMRAIMASPKAEQDTSVAPSISRAKS